MSYDARSSSRGNWLIHKGGSATSVSGLKAGMDTADSDITRPLRPSAMPAGGVLHFLPKNSSPSAQGFSSVVATARGRRQQLRWQHKTKHVAIAVAFQPAWNHHGIQLWAQHPFLAPEAAQGMQEDTGAWPMLLVQPSVNTSPPFMKCAGTSLDVLQIWFKLTN